MKRLLIIIFVVVLAVIFLAKYNDNPKIIISKLAKNKEIEPGNLKYRIYLLGILPIGEAIFKETKEENLNGQEVYHLTITANTLKLFSKLFRGSATLESYVDKRYLNPVLFKQNLISSGKERTDKEIIYDQKQGIMTIDGIRRQIFPDTQDPLSLIFNLRRMNVQGLKVFEMNINTNQRNYILKTRAQLNDISVNKKNYKLIVLKGYIKRRDKNPYHKSTFSMTLAEAKENIPILIKVFTGGFLINAKLIEIN